MKYFFLFFTLFTLCFQVSFALANCPTSDDTNVPLSQYIKDCAKTTNGVDPSKMGEGVDGLKQFIVTVGERVVQFGVLFAVGALVWSGIQYTKSFGDDESLKRAKNTGIYALIGLILLLISFPFVDIIVGFIYDLGR